MDGIVLINEQIIESTNPLGLAVKLRDYNIKKETIDNDLHFGKNFKDVKNKKAK